MKSARERIFDFLQDGWVLVVEPNGNYRASIKQFLANLKVTKVVLATTPQEALRSLNFEQKRWRLIIAEWNLQGTNGLQLLRSIRIEEKFRDVAFLLTSVENLQSDVILAGEVGVDSYLLKPFSYEEFVAQMEVVSRSRLLESDVNRKIEDAETALGVRELDRAERLFSDVLAGKGDSARALHGLARVAEFRGNQNEAISLLKRSIASNSKYINAYRSLLDLYLARKSFADVLSVGLALHQFSPDNPNYCLRIANAYLNLKQPEESEKFFRKTIRLSPKLAVAFKGLGDVCMLRSDYEAAMKNYHKALDLDAKDTSILNSIALAYVRMGKVVEGIQKYQAALRIEPENAGILFNIGYAYERQGDFAKAREYYLRAQCSDSSFEKPKSRLKLLEQKVSSEAPSQAATPSEPAFMDDLDSELD